MDISTLVKLTSRAWSLTILALMHDGVARRQAPLLAASKASRTAFAASLDHLVSLGLLERNPGHGHPLRPEFRLTPNGVRYAAIASRIIDAVPEEEELSLLRRNWTVPILAVTPRPRRFSGIKSDLPTITDRALSISLQQLEESEWLGRDIDTSARPPFPTYTALSKGLEISRAIGLRL
ncbi:winged helix-turn-helix transcriptional regulator [Yoonia litorea]|uniref:Transcriptional regulator, HxlR family n=1 Tax=Yoonia litorea TaxID=1123755 RepID=A0A1I6L4X8_9RHOB|nr:winged helix-turn-helix transcriptional regulator [Yoonia litorea]SFR98535.1 transcriptional regulator, HxlR family [Yoonia litorea]